MGPSNARISAKTASKLTPTGTAKPQHPLIPLIDQIREFVVNESREDPIANAKLLSTIHALQLAAETPTETVYRIGYQSWQSAAIRVALDLGIFDVLVERKPESVSAKELASSHGADVVLVGMLSYEFPLVALLGS